MAFRIGSMPQGNMTLELPHGVTVAVRPLTTAVWQAARYAEAKAITDLRHGEAVLDELGIDTAMLPDLTNDAALVGLGHLLRVQALARAAIVSWAGVLGEDGLPVPVSPEAVNALMLYHDMSEAFAEQYEARMIAILSEGNASGPSPNGISAEGPNTAGAAA